MASTTLACPLVLSRPGPRAKAIGPFGSMFPPRRPNGLITVRAKATGENKDTAVEVGVKKQGNQPWRCSPGGWPWMSHLLVMS